MPEGIAAGRSAVTVRERMNTVLEQEEKALCGRLESVRRRLDDAVRASGRKQEDVTLVAVSKFHPAAAVEALARLAGHAVFGESYVQEAQEKQQALAGLALSWHFIGHVQSRKARDVAGRFALVHTVDSEKLACKLHQAVQPPDGEQPEGACTVQDVLVQVNIGCEPQKSGVAAGDGLLRLADAVAGMSGLRLRGLMCMPPLTCQGEEARPYFAQLRGLRDSLEQRLGMRLPHLSMGMSHDFEQAVAEGATLVRVGTDIFGERSPR